MKNSFKKFIAIVLLLSVFNINPGTANSAPKPPQAVRIGLFTKGDSVNKPVTSFLVSADEGILLGIEGKSGFKELYYVRDNDPITIRKDAFYTVSRGEFKEYNPDKDSEPKGEAVGAYHIQLSDELDDLKDVQREIKKAKKSGVEAYPVYNDGWYMWTGFFANEEDAEKTAKKEFRRKFDEHKVIKPSNTRIAAYDIDDNIIMLFDSKDDFLQINPTEDNEPFILFINQKPYRGAVEVRRFTDSDMTVINVLPIEEYLYGVIPSEIEANSHEEALKAQAVAARTYTINNLNKHSAYGFDLCTTTSCQVYKGFSAEHRRSNDAVNETQGEIVTYKGKPAQVFYHSSSGGMTEDVINVWGSDIPYLKSVEDKYESGKSYNYTWEITYTPEKLKQLLQSKGYDIGEILSVSESKTSKTGRVTELTIKGTKGKALVFKLESARLVLNLHSQWYRIISDANISVIGAAGEINNTQLSGKAAITAYGKKTIGNSKNETVVLDGRGNKKVISSNASGYKFAGKGWGHGVGLSQEGAKGMAEKGFSYDEILCHYFQGTEVEDY